MSSAPPSSLPGPAPVPPAEPVPADFSEKAFYLREFRGRSLGLVVSAAVAPDSARCRSVLEELRHNGTRCLVIASSESALADWVEPGAAVGLPADALGEAEWVGALWARLGRFGRAGLFVDPSRRLLAEAAATAARLGLSKLVILDPEGGLRGPEGRVQSFLDLQGALDLAPALPAERRRALEDACQLLRRGGGGVNWCRPEELEKELFTYAGAGTFLSRERYGDVRLLGLDDLDAAVTLIRQGVREGYLLQRQEPELERILSHAFGVFVERRFLAGIAALLPYTGAGAGELASLYTLTRFQGEGVGGALLAFAAEQARIQGLRSLFACTTREAVEGFFLRHGFRTARPEELPASKWAVYDPARRGRVRCVRRSLAGRDGS